MWPAVNDDVADSNVCADDIFAMYSSRLFGGLRGPLIALTICKDSKFVTNEVSVLLKKPLTTGVAVTVQPYSLIR